MHSPVASRCSRDEVPLICDTSKNGTISIRTAKRTKTPKPLKSQPQQMWHLSHAAAKAISVSIKRKLYRAFIPAATHFLSFTLANVKEVNRHIKRPPLDPTKKHSSRRDTILVKVCEQKPTK